jgi:hypothetical protein
MGGDGLPRAVRAAGRPRLRLQRRPRSGGRDLRGLGRGAVGARDEHGILRVSIVEGDRGGRGYFVHASVDLVVATERAIETGEVIDLDMRALSGDVARWFPQRDPAPLETFKNRYRNEGQCQLVPVLLSDGGIDPRYELGVLSSAVKLRTLAEITDPKDPDYPLVKNA